MRNFIREELTGWKKSEVIWFAFCCAVIVILSIYWGDTPMGIISATTGVACVICTGKGKLSAYIFGLINATLYSIISYEAKLYGETMLNALYYIPMQFVGFFVWSKNMNAETHEVMKRHMKASGRIILVLTIAAGTVAYGFVLKLLGDSMPFVDAFTTFASVVTMVVSVKMYSEQWLIWLAVDAVTVYMWVRQYMAGNENVATLLMWSVYVINAFVMWARWEKEIRGNKKRSLS